MNVFQRAWRSVTRKPIKSILLLLVVFVISLFLLSGMASKTASVKTQDKTRQAVGAGFLLETNETNRHKRLDTADEIIELLQRTAHELRKCVIVVTHSKKLADIADEVIEIKNGSIERNDEI